MVRSVVRIHPELSTIRWRQQVDRAPAAPHMPPKPQQPPAGVPVTGVNELVLEVLDLEEAERFYADTLGLPVVERWEHRDAIWVMAGTQTRIGLWRPQVGIAGGRGGVHVHFAMHLEEDAYDGAVERLRAHGLDVEEVTFPNYEESRAVYASDPDGNVVELWTWDVAGHLQPPPGEAGRAS
jgi:catechol-2,3-dioxygenase